MSMQPLTVMEAVELTSAQKFDKSWTADCPYDSDHKGLLKINENSNGALLVHCYGGCSFYWITRTLREQRDQPLICA
jgi:hypothetical protein